MPIMIPDVRIPLHSQLWESVLSSLRLAIVTGSLPPGTHLVESDLAARLNVSRGPIREALTRLEHEGLVVNYPYRGRFVASVSAEDVREVYELRRLLESRAIESLAGRLATDELNALRELCAQMTQALSEGQNEAFADLDVEFHRKLVTMSGRERLLKMWSQLAGVTHAFIVINTRNDPDNIRQIAASHELIVDALARDDVQTAADTMQVHLRKAEVDLLGVKTGALEVTAEMQG
jgi:GntR family transcriptional regulator, gluconate operon transcriptional repressor